MAQYKLYSFGSETLYLGLANPGAVSVFHDLQYKSFVTIPLSNMGPPVTPRHKHSVIRNMWSFNYET